MNSKNRNNEIVLYTSEKGNVCVEVLFQNENFWLTQKAMAELFGVEIPAISKHLANIYESNELSQEATLSILETVRDEGSRKVRRKLEYYNLDAIIAVGYRVNSYQATQFRIWATKTLKEFIIKGFVLDDERLKQGNVLGKIISMNSWNVFAKSGQVNADSIRKLQIFTPFQLITIKILRLLKIFLQRFRINCIGR
ncbi:MAG: hypothetical protein UZ01_00176 [Candidatus Brocadia sinica]|uniref:Virulence protein-like protein n=1 Tax=Candidatus Brocadia sinica JPN1 TaxID=1197129 RepID=A0ABQ0JW41_9BACT|nr:MAG: hypothetical protein UZ01_00176 [Candidatus Brocadia sinica]GAN32669.1 virulence protein-like protein [Candidatus Brocadia sinica JPN1]GIK13796.1 MAG: hypothetical protein BroJett002_25030 [Candidatus Brocadia sinica]GJQ16986.1 MAG: hypothetical protein HBSIN01_09450 [Candidatus Brocadia sinica]